MTPPPSQFLYRYVQFHPPEADRLAEKIAVSARKDDVERQKIDASVNSLNYDWQGQQKDWFIIDVNPHQRELNLLIEVLRKHEMFFRAIKISRREEYTNPAWEAYQKGKR